MGNNAIIAAAVDIGTNSFRLLISSITPGGCRNLLKVLKTVRLGRGVAQTGLIGAESMELAVQTLASFRKTMSPFAPKIGMACATEVLRTARNGAEFLDLGSKALGLQIEVISGEVEARLSLAGVVAHLKTSDNTPLLLADVGGGSSELIFLPAAHALDTEAILTAPSDILKICSLPLGAVNLTENHLHHALPTSTELAAMTAHIENTLSGPLSQLLSTHKQPLSLLGTGGTATSLAAMALGLAEYDETIIQGYVLTRPQLTLFFNKLSSLTPEQRHELPGVETGRGDIILAGVSIFQTLLDLLHAEAMIISDAGLLEGILYMALHKAGVIQTHSSS